MKRINIGIENFKDIIDNNYYYIDKTDLVLDVLSNSIISYTRPRRFGKTLNMSMLYYFFSNKEKENAYLFDGLKITQNQEIMKHQNQYPVIFITLKEMKGETFQQQKNQFAILIFNVIEKNLELLTSDQLSDVRKQILKDLHSMKASDEILSNSLQILCESLSLHYHQKVILLIDEYDVPLQNAYINGYYKEMTRFINHVFSSALKTNDSLKRGILTGCLRIEKESIFTGLNNFTVRSIIDKEANDYFGFRQDEIDELLSYYHLEDKQNEMKAWYDGYSFGEVDIYNPWSAMNYVSKLLANRDFIAESFWANTSSNDIIREYIENSSQMMKEEFEQLIQGKSIVKKITPELTYVDMDFTHHMNDDIYSFLLFTGYLKIKNQIENDVYELIIPNKEVRMIYNNIFLKWFDEYQKVKRNDFIQSLINGNQVEAIDLLSDVLENSISYYDNYESFYHGFMVGFLNVDGYRVESNKESGEGRFDLALIPQRKIHSCIVIECKHSLHDEDLIADSQKAAMQIENKNYKQTFINKGYLDVIGYGISFYKKQCYITKV